jgi:outer membrane receptor protein involved in Fe transport
LIPEHWNVTANFGRAFRAPTLHERFFFGPHQSTVDQGNPDLDPETSWNFDVGSKVQSRWLIAQMGIFYNYIQDYIQKYATGDPGDDPWSWENIHDAALYGVELDLELPLLSWLSLKGYMTLVRGENLDGGDLVDIPPLKGSYGVRFSYNWKQDAVWLEFMANSAAEQDRTGSQNIEPTPGYTTFDLRSGGKFLSGLSFTLYGKNLADKGYNDHLSRVDQLKYNQPGRSFGASVAYRF